jgi:hypothetical protein
MRGGGGWTDERYNELVRIKGTNAKELYLTVYEYMGLGTFLGRVAFVKKANGEITGERNLEGVAFEDFKREAFA